MSLFLHSMLNEHTQLLLVVPLFLKYGGLVFERRALDQTPSTPPPPPALIHCLRKLVPLGSALSPLRWCGNLRRSWVEGVYKHKPWPLSPPPPPARRRSIRALATTHPYKLNG